jgi:glycosyltransferase involved in cell wall biosynthesis
MKDSLHQNLLVSVLMITYNHEKFISRAIDSVVTQMTNFNFELIIGDDASEDNTKEISLNYQKKYPGIIKVITSSENNGMRKNFLRIFGQSTGEYIAICEGDDYWIDNNKLQKQVDFLLNNPEFSLIYTDIDVVIERGAEKFHSPEYLEFHNRKFYEGYVWDILIDGCFINNPTVCFRRASFNLDRIDKRFLDFFLDQWIWLIVASFSKIKFLNYKSSVYRIHPMGVSTDLKNELSQYQLMIFIVLKYYLKYHPGQQVPGTSIKLLIKLAYRSVISNQVLLSDKYKLMLIYVFYFSKRLLNRTFRLVNGKKNHGTNQDNQSAKN